MDVYRSFVWGGFLSTAPVGVAMVAVPGWFLGAIGLSSTRETRTLLVLLGLMMAGIQVRTLLQALREPAFDARLRLRCVTGAVLDAAAALVMIRENLAGALAPSAWGIAAGFLYMACGFAWFALRAKERPSIACLSTP